MVLEGLDHAPDLVVAVDNVGREDFDLADVASFRPPSARRVAEQVRLPLVGVAADEAVEVLEAHAGRPLASDECVTT
jgi:hypothetical protein